jgi:SUF system NifU family Fe-S assembly protein
VAHVSNALGTILPVRHLVDLAKQRGLPVLLDGAQAVPHLAVDVADLGCDFYAFSSHKAYGPTGVGALWAPLEILEEMGPYQGGGEMIASVSFERTTYNRVPHKFEAGTPNIAGAIGLGATFDYLRSIDLEAAWAYEDALLEYATERLVEVPGTRIIGTAPEKTAVVGFTLAGVHPHDVGTVLDQEGVAVRTGHHCAQPVMDRFGVPATTRASFGIYNTRGVMSDLRDLYQEVILDHTKRPRNFGVVEGASHRAEGNNPLCGDEIRVSVRLDGESIRELCFEGTGCAISTASASLMTEALKGKTLDEAERLYERFHGVVTGEAELDADALGKLAVMGSVSAYPLRVKCATLAWHTLRAALEGSDHPVTTE